MPDRQLTSLSHHIDLEWMYEAYRVTRKDGAVGIDGENAEAFAEELEGNLPRPPGLANLSGVLFRRQ
jgi:hypothetical protein